MRKLNARQSAFVAAYAGNATEAARKAGYTGSDATVAQTGYELLKKPEIAEAIAKRQAHREARLSLPREKALELLAEFALDGSLAVGERLRAVAQAAKMCGWNLQRVQVEAGKTLEQLILEATGKRGSTDGDAGSTPSSEGER